MGPRLVTIALAAILVGAAVPAVTAAPPASHFTDLVDSATLSGPVLVGGVLVDSRGRPAKAEAVLFAMASEDVLAAMQVGDSVKMLPVGRATSNDQGHFQIRADPAVPFGQHASSQGLVNFQVMVDSPDGFAVWSFSARTDAVSSASGDAAGLVAQPQIEAAPMDVTIILDEASPMPDAVPAPVGKTACAETLNSVIGTYWDSIAETYTKTKTNVDWTYLQGASSTLGVGYSATGTYGSWSASGTKASSATSGIDFATVPVNSKRVHKTKFELGKYYNICWYEQGFETHWYLAKSKRWIGSHTYYNAASYPTATKCSSYLVGDHPWIDNHTAVTWTNAFDVSLGIGIDLQSTTGFTTEAKQYWTFLSNGTICGTNDYPETGGKTVVGS